MSYTRSYSTSIKVSGSVSVSYPASEYGGTTTVDYSDVVPINFDVTVATEPFDTSIENAGMRVDGLTASVTAMSAANCAAIAQSSERISDSIVKGFYDLIKNDITTKQTESNTLLQAKSALLLEHSKAVRDKHDRMLADVERERAKFGKVFKELDRELERRITELDRPAFTLSKKAREGVVVQPYLTMAAETADQLGSAGNRGAVEAAGLRSKVMTVLRNLSSSLHTNLMYRRMMSGALWSGGAEEREISYIPVAYCVSDNTEDERRVCRCYVSDSADKNRILASVNAYVSEKGALEPRAIPENELKLIEQAFSGMVQDSYTGLTDGGEYQERVYTEIYRLWKADRSELKQI